MRFQKLIALGLAMMPFLMSAQENVGKPTYEFKRHGYIQLQGGAGYTVGEDSFGNLITPAVAGYLGWQISPVFGLRAGVSGWQAKGRLVTYDAYKYHYLQANLDAVISLTNWWCGYNPKRVFDGYIFAGVAGDHGYHNGEANALNNLTNGDLEY